MGRRGRGSRARTRARGEPFKAVGIYVRGIGSEGSSKSSKGNSW